MFAFCTFVDSVLTLVSSSLNGSHLSSLDAGVFCGLSKLFYFILMDADFDIDISFSWIYSFL